MMLHAGLSIPLIAALTAAAEEWLAAVPTGDGSFSSWEEDDACDSTVEACALSLRQLRIRGVLNGDSPSTSDPNQPEEPPAAMGLAAAPGKDISDTSETVDETEEWFDGLHFPGGWGEAAPFAEEMEHAEAEALSENSTGLQAMSSHSAGSCAKYGCTSKYVWYLSCQCNPSCHDHKNCCKDIGKCGSHVPSPSYSGPHNIMKLYHQTGHGVGRLILGSGFRRGRSGWCGGAIYFATSRKATYTKAIGPDSHKGFMIEATVDVGRVKHRGRHCGGMSAGKLARWGYDSITFNPGDGPEYVIYSPSRVLSMRQVPCVT